MRRWNLKIILKSDLCTAAGDDTPGIINIKTAIEQGIPFIPAKRIKGCLLDAGKEMRDNGLVTQDELDCLFGKSGAEQTRGICIGDAHLYFAPGYLFGNNGEEPIEIKSYEFFQKELQNCRRAEKDYLEEFFTRRRVRTAMEAETGAVRKHSLRTIQVVPAGIAFVSFLEGNLSDEEEKVLVNCIKGFRHLGVGITRGLGEIECVLESVHSEDLESKKTTNAFNEKANLLYQYKPEQKVVLSYEIALDSPLIIDKANECLPAGPILGALAGMYINKHSLGSNAHEDESFSRIFLRDGIQFGYGFLKKNNKKYLPCPKAIVQMKEDEDKWFHIEGDAQRKRKDIHEMVRWEDKALHLLSAHKEIHFHHSRPLDRGIAHALNDGAANTSYSTGEFFQYKALSKGQIYAGTWSGKVKDILSLVECLQDYDFQLRLGKSKTTEYGNCTFNIVDVSQKEERVESSMKGTEWMLWLLTPILIRDEQTGDYTLETNVFAKQLEEVLGCKKVELRKVVGNYITYSGYNSKWRLPSVSCPAIAAGSTYYLKTDRESHSFEIQEYRWGELTGRGCGQVAVRLWDEKETGEIIFDHNESCNVEDSGNEIINRLLCYRKEKMECESIAMEKLDIIHEDELPSSSSISLLSQLLKNYAHSKDFYERIKEEVEHIHKIDKKHKMLKLIKPCEGENYEFMKCYLENAKWKARCRSKDE